MEIQRGPRRRNPNSCRSPSISGMLRGWLWVVGRALGVAAPMGPHPLGHQGVERRRRRGWTGVGGVPADVRHARGSLGQRRQALVHMNRILMSAQRVKRSREVDWALLHTGRHLGPVCEVRRKEQGGCHVRKCPACPRLRERRQQWRVWSVRIAPGVGLRWLISSRRSERRRGGTWHGRGAAFGRVAQRGASRGLCTKGKRVCHRLHWSGAGRRVRPPAHGAAAPVYVPRRCQRRGGACPRWGCLRRRLHGPRLAEALAEAGANTVRTGTSSNTLETERSKAQG